MTLPPPAPTSDLAPSTGGGGSPDPDADLLGALGQGDLEALRPLHRRHAGALLALARHCGLAEPEEAVEDLFAGLGRHAPCHGPSGLPGRVWLLGLAHLHFRGWRGPDSRAS